MKKTASILALFVALLFGLLACSKGSSSGASGKLKVVTTNSILADITKNIAEDTICTVSFLSAKILTSTNRFQKMSKRLRKQTSSSTTGSTSKPVAMLGLLNWSKMPIKLKTKTISQLATESTSSTWKAKTKLEKKTLTLGSISKTGSSTLKTLPNN